MTATSRRRLSALEQAKMNVTLGPYFGFDVPASASTFLSHPHFTAATTVALTTREIRLGQPGRIVGIILQTNADVAGGTLQARASINGAAVPFNAGAAELNTANPVSRSSFVEFPQGIPFAANDTLGVNVLSASLSPTTLDVTAYLCVAFDPN